MNWLQNEVILNNVFKSNSLYASDTILLYLVLKLSEVNQSKNYLKTRYFHSTEPTENPNILRNLFFELAGKLT